MPENSTTDVLYQKKKVPLLNRSMDHKTKEKLSKWSLEFYLQKS